MVFFREAVRHATRIARVLVSEGGCSLTSAVSDPSEIRFNCEKLSYFENADSEE